MLVVDSEKSIPENAKDVRIISDAEIEYTMPTDDEGVDVVFVSDSDARIPVDAKNINVIKKAVIEVRFAEDLAEHETHDFRLRRMQKACLNNDCKDAIVRGFESSALGQVHHYQSSKEYQANILAALMVGEPDEIKCSDSAGVKASRMHTVEQIKQVVKDFRKYRKAMIKKRDDHYSEVDLHDPKKLDEIRW